MPIRPDSEGLPKGGIYSKKRSKPTNAYRKLRRKLSVTPARFPLIWFRHHSFRPEDVFIGSYPRSGTTWSRFVMFEMLTGQEGGFNEVNGFLHGVGSHWTGARILPNGGRLIATHEQYWKQYHKAIYLVRDVRDVLLSEFAYTTALEYFNGDLDKFMNIFLTKKINAFGPWQKHVSTWLNSPIANSPDFLLVRYEDLRQRPEEGFTRIANFLGLSCDAETIRQAIAHNSLDKMKEKEEIAPQRASVKSRFVRTGTVRGFQSKLNPAQLDLVEKYAGDAMRRLGYPLRAELEAAEEAELQTVARR